MPFQKIKSHKKIKDNVFDDLFSDELKDVAEIHFSPIEVVRKAAQYLVKKKGDRILDIGSGAGKFCMIGSVVTDGFFTGVEQRKHLHDLANSISERHNLTNLMFINANIIDIPFQDFDGFYLFNPFYENINPIGKMDDLVELKRVLYDEYSLYVNLQLASKPIGTKLVTYFSYLTEIPDSYRLQSSDFEGKLKMWEKIF
jgi:ubiquinone/menaquinone biosynthesis C-methylase UbiE